MAVYLWEQADLEAELSAEVVRQVFDDNNDGTADSAAITHLRGKSAAYVIGGLQRVYPTLVSDVAGWQADLSLVPERLKQIAIDYAVSLCARRHPEYVRRDWAKLQKHVDDQIARIRAEGLDGLAVETPPEPATNMGGSNLTSQTDSNGNPKQFFNGCGGLGDF